MNNILRLSARRFFLFRGVHLLVVLLVAAVATIMLLYQGYLGGLAEDFRGRLIYPDFPGKAALHVPGMAHAPNSQVQPVLNLVFWEVTVPGGNTRVAGVVNSSNLNWPVPQGDQVWLPASLQGQFYEQAVGDKLPLTLFSNETWKQMELTVAGYYEDGGYLSPLLADVTLLIERLTPRNAVETVIVYPERELVQVRREMSRIRNARLEMLDYSVQGAGRLVNNMYAGGNGAILLGIVFLAIGIGTFALLVFLDSRSEVAILKSLGLKPGEAGRLLLYEFSCSTLLGLLLGWVSLQVLAHHINLPLQVETSLLGFGAIAITAAFLLALIAPVRLLQVATVNELLLKRPILLLTQQTDTIAGRRPALEDLTNKGWSCLKLEQDANGFLATVIPEVGMQVRKGELLAWQPIWFGIGEKRFVAPHDGRLEIVDPIRGVLALSPMPDGHLPERVQMFKPLPEHTRLAPMSTEQTGGKTDVE